MTGFISKTSAFVLQILFPPICLICRKALQGAFKDLNLCEPCLAKIPVNTALTCPRCLGRLADNKKICHREAPYRLGAASFYENPIVKNLVWQLKYQKITAAAKPLSEILFRHLKELKFSFSGYLIIPIPLHPSRERARGFNQSALITETLSKKIGLPVEESALRRLKDTRPQAEARDFEDRRKNVAGSFSVRNTEAVAGKNILLVDDVFTSGATAEAAVRALKAAGAKRVLAAVIARA